jgi:hypothetical protein
MESMVWIQYTLRISRAVFLLVFAAGLPLNSFGQKENVIIRLKSDNTSRLKQNQFYIQEVEDHRKLPGPKLGQIISLGKEADLVLPKSVERDLFDYWSNLAPLRKETYLPLYATINEFYITEKRVGPDKVTGEGKLSVRFSWYRDMQPVELTAFQSSVTFSRTERDYDHSKLIAQMLDQAITHFNKWMVNNIGKSPALARNLILTFKEITGSNDEDTVFYSPKRPLTWNDFTGKGRPGSRYAAAVFTSFAYEGSSFPKGTDLVIEIGLKIFMVKSMSWGNSDARNANTIRHEQIHFDIARMVAERFKERLRKAGLTIEDYDSEIQYQFLESFREMNTEQEKYDAETSHGINNQEQTKWDLKVTKAIAEIYSTD